MIPNLTDSFRICSAIVIRSLRPGDRHITDSRLLNGRFYKGPRCGPGKENMRSRWAEIEAVLKEDLDYALSTSEIEEACNRTPGTIKTTMKLKEEEGVVESTMIGHVRYWRLKGSTIPFPPNNRETITSAIEALNRRLGRGVTAREIQDETGCEIAAVHRSAHYLLESGVVRAGIKINHRLTYILNKSEFDGLAPKKGYSRVSPEPVKRPITPEEVAWAKDRSRRGTVIAIRERGDDGFLRTIYTQVKKVYPHFCYMENGYAIKWSDMVNYYRGGRKVVRV